MTLPPFHLAFPVHDLEKARAFYGGVLGCPEGRSAAHWIDFDFFGHQIVTHLAAGMAPRRHSNPVDGHDVPVPHFGAVLWMEEWRALADRLKAAGTEFVIEPTIRFAGEPGSRRRCSSSTRRAMRWSSRQCATRRSCSQPIRSDRIGFRPLSLEGEGWVRVSEASVCAGTFEPPHPNPLPAGEREQLNAKNIGGALKAAFRKSGRPG